jgi:hypothetical protein
MSISYLSSNNNSRARKDRAVVPGTACWIDSQTTYCED